MKEPDHNRTQPLEQVALRHTKIWATITLIIVSVLPASLIAYWAGFISGKTALLTSLLIVILVGVLIGKPTFYSAQAKKS